MWQTAVFDPHGLAGFAYWYALYPIHNLIFEGMLRGIRLARTQGRAESPAADRRRTRRGTATRRPVTLLLA